MPRHRLTDNARAWGAVPPSPNSSTHSVWSMVLSPSAHHQRGESYSIPADVAQVDPQACRRPDLIERNLAFHCFSQTYRTLNPRHLTFFKEVRKNPMNDHHLIGGEGTVSDWEVILPPYHRQRTFQSWTLIQLLPAVCLAKTFAIRTTGISGRISISCAKLPGPRFPF
jgi:hypothetical protein